MQVIEQKVSKQRSSLKYILKHLDKNKSNDEAFFFLKKPILWKKFYPKKNLPVYSFQKVIL